MYTALYCASDNIISKNWTQVKWLTGSVLKQLHYNFNNSIVLVRQHEHIK